MEHYPNQATVGIGRPVGATAIITPATLMFPSSSALAEVYCQVTVNITADEWIGRELKISSWSEGTL